MKCAECQNATNGLAGDNCLLRKTWKGLSQSFCGGCNLTDVNVEHKAAEVKRVESLPDLEIWPKGIAKAEKQLQHDCEGLLRQWGYRASTAPEIAASLKPDATPVKGWYIHLWNARENPMLPDLLIMDTHQMRCISIELKVVSKYSDGQLEFIECGMWHECRSVEEFVKLVKGWEQQQ